MPSSRPSRLTPTNRILARSNLRPRNKALTTSKTSCVALIASGTVFEREIVLKSAKRTLIEIVRALKSFSRIR